MLKNPPKLPFICSPHYPATYQSGQLGPQLFEQKISQEHGGTLEPDAQGKDPHTLSVREGAGAAVRADVGRHVGCQVSCSRNKVRLSAPR